MADQLHLTSIRTYWYRMPLKRAYGTARGVTKAGVNFLVQVSGQARGRVLEGVGECQPRHALTGDGGKDRVAAWTFLCAAADRLHGRTLLVDDRNTALGSVRAVMSELGTLARDFADDTNRDRPYRGTLLGIEVALLDLAARALDLQLAELLGKRRDDIGISISTISSSVPMDQIEEKVLRQKRFPMTRVKGTGELDHDLELVERVSMANRSAGRDRPIWIDINEAHDISRASRFITELVSRMAHGQLPSRLLVEGMLPKAQVTELPRLQRQADAECRGHSNGADLDLRVMPDEGMWDADDLARVNAAGGCRALNIKAPKAGGLLASLDLAEAAVAADPDIHVCIGGMIGTSDITAWALHNLARALPRVDYLTAVPPMNVRERISDPLVAYRERGSNVIAVQHEPGLGARLLVDKLMPYLERMYDPADPQKARDLRRPALSNGRTTPVVEQAPAAPGVTVKTLTLGGDTSLGDVHARAKGGSLLNRLQGEPMSFFEGLSPLVAEQDYLILNLETVLADAPTSPHEGTKAYLGWDSPARTVQCLQKLGVNAVGLANNHTMDFGASHLLGTRRELEQGGIVPIGAGATEHDAAQPLTIALDFSGTVQRVHVIAAMEEQSKLRDEFGFYATGRQPGVNSMRGLVDQVRSIKTKDPSSLVVAYPHWGRNYRWVTDSARRRADALIAAGADLIVGHGAHMLQQCTFDDNHAVVYSLGNFMFNWAGRFAKFDAPPFGLVARVGLGYDAGWEVELRLYPVVIDNRATDYRPRLADEAEFNRAWSVLAEMDLDGSFAARATAREDHLGRHIGYRFSTGLSGTVTGDAPAKAALPPRTPVARVAEPLSSFSQGSTTYLLAKAVIDRGLPHRVEEVPGSRRTPDKPRTALRFTTGGKDYFVRGGTIVTAGEDGLPGPTIDGPAVRICGRKDVTKTTLAAAGFSVPAGMSFSRDDLRGALLYFDAFGASAERSLCVKPANGNKGRSIYLGLTARTAFKAAFEQVGADFETVLVEESVRGDVLRFLTVGGTVVAVRRGVPARVTGDGQRTVTELVATKNAALHERGADRHTILRLGDDALAHLSREGWTPESVPGQGEQVYLSALSNRHAAAEIVDCTDDVHPSYMALVEEATTVIPGLSVCGVDLMIGDFTAPATAGNHYFIELNTTPGLRGHHAPNEGRSRDVAGMIVDFVTATLP